MAFSPRARPDTIHLAFSDADLTDTYRDERSSAAASSPRARHPRGDTPLSRRRAETDDTGTSPGRWSVSRRSASELDGPDERDDTLRELSNLDKLLVLLDGDEPEETWVPSPQTKHSERSVEMSTPPPTMPQSSRPPPAPTTIRRQDISLARPTSYSRPPHSAPSASIISATSTTATDSPSMRAARSSSFRPPLSGRAPSAVELLQRANGFGAPRDGLPDSPSPRPGSVAALRKSEADRSGVDGGKGKERAWEAAERTDAAVNGSAEEYEETVASVDSITRVAEAALHEFDTIVSHDSQGRSASRLRNIPSPPPSAPPSSGGNRGHPAASSAHPESHRHDHTYTADDGEDVNSSLLQELRDAQDYIAYLQDELHAINGVVHQLRERPEAPTAYDSAQHAHYEQERPSSQDAHEQVEATTQAAFEVVKHTLAMLPSMPSSSPSTAPDLLSLHRALAFTRSVDQLAHRTRDLRRDEDVFGEENLRAVLRVVGGWAAQDKAGR
ncbi:hypothetical protein JCM10449v2_005908 [Rhodotorula kratochvilovae]